MTFVTLFFRRKTYFCLGQIAYSDIIHTIMKFNFSVYSKGLGFIVVLAIAAYLLAPLIPGMNSVLLGLLFGLIAGNLIKLPQSLQPGINYSSSRVLEIAIVLLAFDINLSEIGKMGWTTLTIIIATIVLVLLLTRLTSKLVKCPGESGLLVGFGTAICGSSAIAAVAPGITKNKEDIGVSMAVINLIGGIGMVILPLILSYFDLSNLEDGIVIGGSLHSVGNVTGAGYAMGEETGAISLTVKMIRVALLAPAVIFFTLLINRKQIKNFRDYFKLPFYLWAFIAVTLFSSYIPLSAEIKEVIGFLATLTLTMAMTAIGMKISFANLYKSGRKAIGFGFIIFAIQLLVISVLLLIIN